MNCPYNFYKSEEKYYPRLYCKIDDKACIYSKRCLKVEKFIPIEGELWKGCYKYMENRIKDIPNGSYFVESYRPNKQNRLYLYIDYNGKTIKVLSDFTEINQNYIYVKEEFGKYNVSLVPFEEKKKKSYTNKTKRIKTEEE